jgi:peptidoglycan hydrolase FlgJ
MMLNGADLNSNVAFDANSLNKLKLASKESSPEAIKAVAKQFEAIFMNMMLKSMREATPQDNPFDSEQSRTFTSMLDQQLSSNLATKGLGLADILAKQLSKTGQAASNAMEQAVSNVGEGLENATTMIKNTISPDLNKASDKTLNQKITPIDKNSTLNKLFNDKALHGDSNAFKQRLAHHAEAASRSSGVPAHLMLGQAALESGWGKREIKGADGTPSNNLFGIKATGNWGGKVVEAMTTEYINGVKQKRIEKFRAYDSYADSFKDFAKLMTSNPRYEKVVASLNNVYDYAQAMQKAGYATDPNYATKLTSVIKKITGL